jgi:hypothetical protein
MTAKRPGGKSTYLAKRVGGVRPSQMTHTYGVGALVELPYLSVVVNSIDQWKDPVHRRTIVEPRLLDAVRHDLYPQVATLETAPWMEETQKVTDAWAHVGVDAWAFPRWLRCSNPVCHRIAPIEAGLFTLKVDPYKPHEAGYWHEGCIRGRSDARALPVRFVVACPAGHLDDFPWDAFVHRDNPRRLCPQAGQGAELRLEDSGYAQRATDLEVVCKKCDAKAGMMLVFGETAEKALPRCRGRHPQAKDYDAGGCDNKARAMLLGASNLWFGMKRSALSIPEARDPVVDLATEHWDVLSKVPSVEALQAKADAEAWDAWPWLVDAHVDLAELWAEIERRRSGGAEQPTGPVDLLTPEWEVFTTGKVAETDDFSMSAGGLPATVHADRFDATALITRVREVVALTGFTRIDSLDADDEGAARVQRAPITGLGQKTSWVPASESRGEGVFVRLDEDAVRAWEDAHTGHPRLSAMVDAHRSWRTRRDLDPDVATPAHRFVLVHTLSHLLINELALEAGYSTASIRERIYARPQGTEREAMAGILLYTAEPDSEGTLGGLVALGKTKVLGRVIDNALRRAQLCSTDPFCAEHEPQDRDGSLHGAACHSCVFLPETSCQSANRYLDRAAVVPTLSCDDLAYFPWTP